MTIPELLEDLEERGIRLWKEDGELRFSAPKGAMTQQLKDTLRLQRDQILRTLREGSPASPSRIPRTTEAGHYALSNAQQRLWILSQIEGATTAYNIPLHLRLEGELDAPCLEAAFERVIERHESLRTTFAVVEGEPRQIVHDGLVFQLATVDLSDRDRPEDAARELATSESTHAFDLETGPLLRARLVRMSQHDHVLLCTLHHTISDGVSIGVLFREIAAFYNAGRRGAPAPLPDLLLQYRDYASWQRQHLESTEAAVHRDYWSAQLGGKLPVLDLPTDAPRPPIQTYHGKEIGFSLGVERSAALRRLARERQASLFMVLLAHFTVLLHRYTGAADLLIGTPVAGRNHPDLAEQIGFYLNSLPIRMSPASDQSFFEVLTQVRRTCLEAFEHQTYPFDRLIDDLRVPRDLSRSPVFDVMMILQNQDDAPPDFEQMRCSLLAEHTGTSKVDITLCCKDMGDEIWANLEYNTDLFSHDRMQRMAGHFTRLIDSVLAEPEQCVGLLDYLTESEKSQLDAWNRTQAPYPSERTVIDLIDETCRRRPTHVAIEAHDRHVSYEELEQESNRLAAHLVKGGIRSGDRVGLCIDRGADLVVSLIAILKAGASYVPLDPHHPAERLRDIVTDAGVKHLLTTSDLGSAAADHATDELETIFLDRDRHIIRQQPASRPRIRVAPEQACYTIYTSGSTGRPKGVVISHQALVNFLWSMASRPGLAEQDRLLAVTTVAFDIAALELLLPLVTGAQLLIAHPSATTDPAQLRQILITGDVSVMQATPATWRMLLEAGWEGTPGLRILCGGEALGAELANRLGDLGSELWNLYGPTETTIWSTIYRVQSASKPPEPTAGDAIPIGRPIANTQIYILDADLRRVPIGVSGDLYIGGHGLAQGYHGQPRLTEERFIAHPFSQNSSARLYHTGDRARHRPDGDIEYLGRTDLQVKIRGYRIETGEVEARLVAHDQVHEALVIATKSGPDLALVAYLVGEPITVAELREWLRRQLPDYMVPSVFMHLDALPLSPSGKINRGALPQPDIDTGLRGSHYAEPRDELEKTITDAWQDVLGVGRVGILDDFFDLGGHSLTATRIIFRLQRDDGLALQLMDLFRCPTVEGLAAVARSRGTDASDPAGGGTSGSEDSGIDHMTAEELAMLEE